MKKTSVQSNINLETLAGGAFAEKLNEALMQVAENIQNPNTEATTKRQILNDLQTQEPEAEPAQATTPAANATQPAAGTTEQQPTPTGKPLDLKNRNKKQAEVPADQEQEKAEAAAGELVPGVEQPASDFVFRVSEGRGGAPVFKLVTADGGVWKSQAVANVKAYLTEALKDIPDRDKITIIA